MADSERIWLSSPTMHGEEQAFVKEAFDTNWVAPLGKNVTEFENEMANLFAQKYDLLKFAGSDNHSAANQDKLAGVCFDEPICSVEDFIEKVKNGTAEIFTLKHE